MSLLPGQIMPESVAWGRVDAAGEVHIDHNWYLFLYNLALSALTTPNAAPVPASPSDLIDMTDLDAAASDFPHILQQIANLEQIYPVEEIAVSLSQLANAILLASEPLLQDPSPPPGAVIAVTVGASPFSYKALHDGTIFVSGSGSTAISITRYGTTIPAGTADGAFPVRKNDTLNLTWGGATAPTVNFLPNK